MSVAPQASAPSAHVRRSATSRAAAWSAAAFAGCLLIGVLRNPAVLQHPALGWDEKVIFGAFYAGRGGPLYLYPDYVSVLQNLIFSIAFLFRTSQIASALVTVSAVVQAFGAAFFSLPMFSRLIRSSAQRVAVCLLLAAMPIGNISIISSPAYQNWTSLAVVSLIAGAWLASYCSAGRRLSISILAVAILCSLSQPLSICLVPIYGALVWTALRDGDVKTALQGGALAAVSFAAGIEAFTLGRDAPHAQGVQIERVLASVARAPLYVLDRSILEAFIGTHWRNLAVTALPGAGPGLAPALVYVAGGAIATGFVCAALRSRDRALRLFLLSCLAVDVCLAMAILPALEIARPGFSDGMLLGLSRYWYAQRSLTIIAFGCLLCGWAGRDRPEGAASLPIGDASDRGASESPTAMEQPRGSQPVRGRIVRCAGAASLVAWITVANVGQSELYGRASSAAEWTQASQRQRAFLRWVEAGERTGAEGCRAQGPEEPEPRLRLELPRGRGGSSSAPCTLFPGDP